MANGAAKTCIGTTRITALRRSNRERPCVRDDYKLIEHYDPPAWNSNNLAEDIGEKVDLASKMPEKATELRKKIQDWLQASGRSCTGITRLIGRRGFARERSADAMLGVYDFGVNLLRTIFGPEPTQLNLRCC